MRYEAKKNRNGGPGWSIWDNTTGETVAWIYDQRYGAEHPEEDDRRAKLFADMLNGEGNP